MASVASDDVAEAFIAACLAELQAPKPGNVHVYAAGHGMATQDFIDSARAAAPFISAPDARVGVRILGAMQATWNAVGKNTNLGILLLCAPLAQAALARPGTNLRSETGRVLANLDVADANAAFGAIRLAQPAGLGAAPEHDVSAPACTTLLEAMRAAAHRDRIGFQYSSNFSDIFDIGVPTLTRARDNGAAPEMATLMTFLAFLQAFPDSHIVRKHGMDVAERVRLETFRRFAPLSNSGRTALFAEAMDWDRALKKQGLNPGTSADLTVAALFADKLATNKPASILAKAAKND